MKNCKNRLTIESFGINIVITTYGEGRYIVSYQGSQVSYYGKARSRGVGDRLAPLYAEFPVFMKTK